MKNKIEVFTQNTKHNVKYRKYLRQVKGYGR